MKSIVASLLAIYIATNGQNVPNPPPEPPLPALIAIQTPPEPPIDPITPIEPPQTLPNNPNEPPLEPPVDPTPPIPVDPVVEPPVDPPVDQLPATPATPIDPAATGPNTTPGTPQVISPAPTTPAPITEAPTTPAPITQAPTSAPTTNPYCTPGLGAMAQQSMMSNFGQGYTQCTSYSGPGSIARDMMGHLECVDGGCCMCSEISCGLSPGMACQDIQFNDYSAVGVQNIQIKGSLAWNMVSFGNWQQGTQVNCNGQQSCRSARIKGELIGEMQCSGWFACNDAIIVIDDPAPNFDLYCDGPSACAGTDITINIKNCASFAELGQFQFNSAGTASGASITVNNYCPSPVIIDHLNCQQAGSCQGTSFRFNGNVQIQNCEIFGAAQLPPQCQFGGFGGGFPQFNPSFPMPPIQQPQYPQFPPQPPVQQPAMQPPAQSPPAGQQPVTVTPPNNPASPGAPPQQPGTPATPATPQQPTPGFGAPQPNLFSVITGLGGQCEMPGQCRGPQTVTVLSNSFELSCIEPGSCSGMALTLNVPAGGFVDSLDGFRFEAPFAAQGASITINSPMFAPLEIQRIRCDVMQSCAGVTINAQGIDLSNLQVECGGQGACTGGSINGISFDMLSGSNFQGGAFPMGFPQQQPGFGAPQVPQPGFGAPQVPQQPGFQPI